MNSLTPAERQRGLTNVAKLRADLKKISDRKNFDKRNYGRYIQLRASQLPTISSREFNAQFGRTC